MSDIRWEPTRVDAGGKNVFYYTISITVEGEQFKRIAMAAQAVGVSVDEFVLTAAMAEAYEVLGEDRDYDDDNPIDGLG